MILTNLNATSGIEGWLRPTTSRLVDGDYVALIFNYQEGYKFDHRAAAQCSGKKHVIFDYAEYGTPHSWNNTHLLGVTTQHHRPVGEVAEYLKLDEYLKQQNVALYFKREFSQKLQDHLSIKSPFMVEPIEIFFDNLPPIEPISKEEYMSRHGLVFHLFGNSHSDRKQLAGEMMKRFERICTSLPKMVDLVNASLPFHLVEQIEHLSRYSMPDILHWQSKCLMSVNGPGFGQKALRMRESYHNSVPIFFDVGMKYSIQPSDENAVMLPTENGKLMLDESFEILESVIRDRENLWHRFQNAHNVAHAMMPDNYVRDQVNEKIKKYL